MLKGEFSDFRVEKLSFFAVLLLFLGDFMIFMLSFAFCCEFSHWVIHSENYNFSPVFAKILAFLIR